MSGGSMTKTYRSVIALLAGVVVIAVAIPPYAVAGKPTIERSHVDRAFPPGGLSGGGRRPARLSVGRDGGRLFRPQ